MEKFAGAPTLSESQARIAHAEWLANVEARLHLVAARARGEGADLSHKQAHALAGRWYQWKVAAHVDEPGSAARWASEIVELLASLIEPDAETLLATPPAASSAISAPTFAELLNSLSVSRPHILGRCAELSRADVFLAQERLILSPAGRQAFLAALIFELIAANALLRRRAQGDYSPDPRPARFPDWQAPTPRVGEAMNALELYRAWAKANEKRTSVSTRNRWITVFRHMDVFFKGGEERAIAWRDDVRAGDGVSPPRSDKTVNFQYVAAAKAVFGWAARPKTNEGGALISASPFANFKLTTGKGARKTVKLRERSFRQAEMKLILPAARAIELDAHSSGLEKAKKWAPWFSPIPVRAPAKCASSAKRICTKFRDATR